MLTSGAAIILLFYRELGLVRQRANPKELKGLADLAREGIKTINRQPGSGTRHYFDLELSRLGIRPEQINGYEETVATHLEVGLRVLRREADAGVATRTVAQLLGLEFVPLARERFDILIPQDRFFSQPVQILLDIVGSRDFRNRVEAMGGYDASESGRIIASN
jgi:molybdate-binding protein